MWIAFLRFFNRVKRSSSLCSNIHSTKKIRSSFSRTSFLPVSKSFFPVASTLKSTSLLFITETWAVHVSKNKKQSGSLIFNAPINNQSHKVFKSPLGCWKGKPNWKKKKAGRQADNHNSTTFGWNTTRFLPWFIWPNLLNGHKLTVLFAKSLEI